MAAITTAPWSISTVSPSIVSGRPSHGRRGQARARRSCRPSTPRRPRRRGRRPHRPRTTGSAAENALRASLERDPVLGRRGPAIDGSMVERSSSTTWEYVGCSSGSCQSPFARQYPSTSSTCSLAPAGEAQIAERLVIDREVAAGGAVLRRHVSDRGTVGERQSRQAVAEVLHELPDDPGLAQDLSDREHEVGRGGALRQRPVEAETDDLGYEHRDRLAEHRRLGLDPADTPAEDAEPVDHRRVRVGADDRVGEGRPSRSSITRARNSRLT